MMRKVLSMAAVMAVSVLAVSALAGCQQQPPKETTSARSVLDVRPTARAATPLRSTAPQMVVPPQEPSAAPVYITSTTPIAAAPAAGPVPAGKRTDYVVKKGDTLFRIAQTQYGDGKKWTVIASANPGLSPQMLRIGQTILIP